MPNSKQIKKLKMGKLKGYIPYPFLMTILWFSKNKYIEIFTMTGLILYIILHQSYFFYKETNLDKPKIGF